MARIVCITPCVPDISGLVVRVPGMPEGIQGVASLDVSGGCSGCDAAANFLIQIKPIMLQFQFPLCIVKCVFSLINPKDPSDDQTVIGSMLSVFESLTSPSHLPPDVTKIYAALGLMAANCLPCFNSFFNPLLYACMIEDLLKLVISIIDCVENLVTHLLTLRLKATGLESSPVIEVQEAGSCLAKLVDAQTETLAVKFNAVGEVFKLVSFFLTLIPGVPCLPTSITISPSVQLGDFIAELEAIKALIIPIRDTMHGICNLNPVIALPTVPSC